MMAFSFQHLRREMCYKPSFSEYNTVYKKGDLFLAYTGRNYIIIRLATYFQIRHSMLKMYAINVKSRQFLEIKSKPPGIIMSYQCSGPLSYDHQTTTSLAWARFLSNNSAVKEYFSPAIVSMLTNG